MFNSYRRWNAEALRVSSLHSYWKPMVGRNDRKNSQIFKFRHNIFSLLYVRSILWVSRRIPRSNPEDILYLYELFLVFVVQSLTDFIAHHYKFPVKNLKNSWELLWVSFRTGIMANCYPHSWLISFKLLVKSWWNYQKISCHIFMAYSRRISDETLAAVIMILGKFQGFMTEFSKSYRKVPVEIFTDSFQGS